MLSTAAGLDFKQHIILVQARGDRAAALRLWQSVGTVVHFRPGDGFEDPGPQGKVESFMQAASTASAHLLGEGSRHQCP